MLMALLISRRKSQQRIKTPKQSLSFAPATPALYTFTILQIADIHLGEAEDTEWGPEQDVKTFRALRKILSHQRADLLIFSGDQLTANNVDANATTYYKILGDFIDSYKIPWGIIFGNHDDADFEASNGTIYKAKTRRTELLLSIQPYSFGVTRQDSPANVFGVSNYVLNVYLQETIAVQIILLDSGGGRLPTEVQQSQLDWISTVRLKDTPAVVFQHIPTQQYVYSRKLCVGSNGDGGIDPVDEDPGIVDYLSKDGQVHFLAVGHNHGNSYCCRTSSGGVLSLCFGRHSGYGGYGSFHRGSRVYELTVNVESGELSFKSWIQMESGDVVERYPPQQTSYSL